MEYNLFEKSVYNTSTGPSISMKRIKILNDFIAYSRSHSPLPS